MRFFELLQESFPIAKKTFMSQGATSDKIKQYFDKYKELKTKNIIPDEHAKDIVQWTKDGWNKFKRHVDDWEHAPSKKSLSSVKKPPPNETINLHEDDNWLIVIPLSHNSSCFHGRESDWCTTKPLESHYSDYVLDKNVTLIYVLHKQDGGMYAIAYHNDVDKIELFDKQDETMNTGDFTKATSFSPGDLVKLAKKHDPAINQGRQVAKETDPVVLAKKAIKTGQRNKAGEKYIMRHPEAALKYAKRVIRRRWPQGEKAIAADLTNAYEYAKDVIKGRWPEAEKTIASDPGTAHLYAKDVIKGRWPEAEKTIAPNPAYAYLYARDVIKGRWPESEKTIASDPFTANLYAQDVIKGRWPAGEKTIASNPEYAFSYAKDVIEGRWPEAEKTIALNPVWAYLYAKDVIEGRWPEAEKAIAADPAFAVTYNKTFGTNL